MKLSVYTKEGAESGKNIELDASVFGIEPNNEVLHRHIVAFRAAQRQGTASTKGRSQITGSTRKLFRQKGTGNARRGDIKAGILRGGGTMFGPKPRNYRLGLNKKMKQLARKSALAYKAKEQAITVVEDFVMDAISTKQINALLAALQVSGKKVLLLTTDLDTNLYRSASNLAKIKVEEARNATTYDIMNAEVVVFQEGAVQKLTDLLNRKIRETA